MRPIYRTGVKLPSRCPILYLFNKYPYWIFYTCCIISIFFSSKCRLFHNATLFGFCITHILNTGCAKIWKKSVGKRLIFDYFSIVFGIKSSVVFKHLSAPFNLRLPFLHFCMQMKKCTSLEIFWGTDLFFPYSPKTRISQSFILAILQNRTVCSYL